MKRALVAVACSTAVAGTASATFVGYYTTLSQTANSGVNLDRYTLYARFNGATDTVLNAFNLCRTDGGPTNIFWHKDNASYNSGVLSQSFGTWNPAQTGSSVSNRPFDSFLSIGCVAGASNSTTADPSWPGGQSWNRPDIPSNCLVGWFNSNPPNLQGRVGAVGNPADSVCLGQFVLSRGTNGGTWSLTIGYNDGVTGSPVQFGSGFFSLPGPGAVSLLGLAGCCARRRR